MSTPLPPGWNSYVNHDTKTGIYQWEHPQPKPAVIFMPQPTVQQPAVQQQQYHMEQLRQTTATLSNGAIETVASTAATESESSGAIIETAARTTAATCAKTAT
ncbi:11706_t:CDS:2 [Rhizophagus irregularis]|nr:11706_t:CDS:2 [Rhizophagus irregularis]